MRLLLASLLVVGGALYAGAALHSYREERLARADSPDRAARVATHPEANLRVVREAMEGNDYSDPMLSRLERAFEQAPAFYQPPLLLAAFYANRLENPETIRRSFEAALARFGSNGRLHLTYAEWLLTPRATAPYRSYRDEPDKRAATALALDHLQTAAAFEPDLARDVLDLMLRARVPVSQWAERIPATDEAKALLLRAFDRAPADPDARRKLLSELLGRGASLELHRSVADYGKRWNENSLAIEAAAKWREAALREGLGGELARATAAMVRYRLDALESEGAYRLLRDTLALMQERSIPSEHAVELLRLVGEDYLSRRQTATAQAVFAEAVTLSRFHVPARLGLARTYLATGDLDAARQEIGEVLEIDPSNAEARLRLEELERMSLGSPVR
jgi:tetratricopeptide (TPR) repeat protein